MKRNKGLLKISFASIVFGPLLAALIYVNNKGLSGVAAAISVGLACFSIGLAVHLAWMEKTKTPLITHTITIHLIAGIGISLALLSSVWVVAIAVALANFWQGFVAGMFWIIGVSLLCVAAIQYATHGVIGRTKK